MVFETTNKGTDNERRKTFGRKRLFFIFFKKDLRKFVK